MDKLKDVASRAAALFAAVGLVAGLVFSMAPSLATSADALNPLTKRSLTLTSSSPGWAYTDGSGNTTYAPAGSGANGKQTGETFTFDTSTDSTAQNAPQVEAFSLQYCTSAAGSCLAPGNDSDETYSGSGTGCGDGAGYVCPTDPTFTAGTLQYTDDSTHTDFNVTGTWTENAATISTTQATAPTPSQLTPGSYGVFECENATDGTCTSDWVQQTGWTMSTSNVEDPVFETLPDGDTTDTPRQLNTGANNLITLTNSSGLAQEPASNTPIAIVFAPSDTSYITNPGAGAFFVKINDYSNATYQDWSNNIPNDDSGADDYDADVIDGGVTVANVMNQSIEIQTKVLETMEFSVGTTDPDTLAAADVPGGVHNSCDAILPDDPADPGSTSNPSDDTLMLGDPNAQYSLSPEASFGTDSLWRLSTNSANGATVYYTGSTLHDTEGNEIAPMVDDNSAGQTPGTDASNFSSYGGEQFGLGLNYTASASDPNVPSGTDQEAVPSSDVTGADKDLLTPYSGSGLSSDFLSTLGTEFTPTYQQNAPYWYTPTLSPLVPEPSYGDAINAPDGAFNGADNGIGPKYAFNSNANTTPVPIASEDSAVVKCSTGQVNYVANIAASTPAGIYTTKINYLAAPEY